MTEQLNNRTSASPTVLKFTLRKKKIAKLQRPQLLQNMIEMNNEKNVKRYKAKLSLLGSVNIKLLSNNYKSF